MNPSDAELMLRVQQGEAEPFDTLVSRYRAPLLRAALSKLGDPLWAEDVVQETFLAVFAARQSFNPQFAFRTWLWTILLNLCRRQWQRRATRPAELPHGDLRNRASASFPEPASAENVMSHVLLLERQSQLAQLLGELPEPEADALRLRFFGELPFDEIARAMSSSVSGAKVRVRRGLERLAVRLAEIDAEPTALPECQPPGERP